MFAICQYSECCGVHVHYHLELSDFMIVYHYIDIMIVYHMIVYHIYYDILYDIYLLW